MYSIIDGRGTGKTSRLMLLAKENQGIIVCSNPHAMIQKSYNYGITGIDFISYQDFIQHPELVKNRNFYIDELTMFIRYYTDSFSDPLNCNFDGFTLSEDD